MAGGAVSDGEARSLVADQLETAKVLLHVTRIWDKILTFSLIPKYEYDDDDAPN